MLLIPNYNETFLLKTDANNTGLGAVLLQETKGRWETVNHASKKLTLCEQKYGITEKEMYAVFWGIKRFEFELRRQRFILHTDHRALEQIRNKSNFQNARVMKWIEKS